MKGMADARRVRQSFQVGRTGLSDLVSLYTTIEAWDTLLRRISQERSMEDIEMTSKRLGDWECLHGLISRMSDLQLLSQQILAAIELEPETIVGSDTMDPDIDLSLIQETEVDVEFSDKPALNKWRVKRRYARC